MIYIAMGSAATALDQPVRHLMVPEMMVQPPQDVNLTARVRHLRHCWASQQRGWGWGTGLGWDGKPHSRFSTKRRQGVRQGTKHPA